MNNDVTLAINEPIKNYSLGSPERISLKKKLNEMENELYDIPIIIGGKEFRTGNLGTCIKPHQHDHVLAKFHMAREKEIDLAIKNSLNAWENWSQTSLQERIKVFKRAAKLLAGPWRDTINAATMLNQSKNVFQAEIDAACELIDFFNFNAQFAEQIHNEQPLISPEGMHNHLEYRPLEGFIFAVSPFNFTSIAGNLPTAPAIMGNVALWKPASTSVYSSYFIMKLLEEAGLPDGVINFIPGSGRQIGNIVMKNPNLSGIHFTGSTEVFQNMWKTIGDNINTYNSYPRIVGETGGKDFILAHESSNIEALGTAMLRGAFEYQGQKCSAASRCYIPKSIWEKVEEFYLDSVNSIKMGDVNDFENFMNAVIDENSFNNISNYIKHAQNSSEAKIISGGNHNNAIGYFIEPTSILTTNPKFKTMEEEIFGPVLSIYTYDESWEEICAIVNQTSPYGLTGAIFSENKDAINSGTKFLRHSAGNFYINDKPTGAVVGQQPFGGGRASGTNDKAGSTMNLLRWISIRTIKENFSPPKSYEYPFMQKD
ncbi:MAG: L-glutamate gamma-semialdehyde dehydrogenase [Candidatus Neomarinimicrobiota bacterium]|nr:L-glutamate gamma-semialdehyde dehydrogenase [Candidatus Neomarinimicrobiota bacterium]